MTLPNDPAPIAPASSDPGTVDSLRDLFSRVADIEHRIESDPGVTADVTELKARIVALENAVSGHMNLTALKTDIATIFGHLGIGTPSHAAPVKTGE